MGDNASSLSPEPQKHWSDGDFIREDFNEIESPKAIAENLQSHIDEIVRNHHAADWSENYLNYELVRIIRHVLCAYRLPQPEGNAYASKFDVEAYKLTGKAEETHGDIAVVISRPASRSGFYISGVGFYEAKISSIEGCSYPHFSRQQLRRLVTKTPKLSCLLYDKFPQPSSFQEWPLGLERREDFWNQRKYHVRTVDANLLKGCSATKNSIGDIAASMGQAFGYHFVYKILSGRELDYSRPPIETIRRWLKVTRRTQALVVSICIQGSESQYFQREYKGQLSGFEKIHIGDLSGSPGFLPPST